MANEFERDQDLEKTRRISPYQELPQDEAADEEIDGYTDEYEDEYADDDTYDEYDDEYGEDEEEEQPGGLRGFLSTVVGKIAACVIVLLLVALIALLAMSMIMKPDRVEDLPGEHNPVAVKETEEAPETKATSAPGSIVFAPTMQTTPSPHQTKEETPAPTQAPTQKPTATPTTAPTAVPEPTATPLPIVLTNTATPSPSPTPSPTPTATPTPSPTPTAAPTAVPEIGTGKVNREANLRESAASNGKVKQTVKKGETVTIHETVLDKDNKVWFGLTVDDLAVTGWMRDYVVDSEDKIAAPTHTPKPTATPGPEETEAPEKLEATAEPTATPNPSAIGAGTTKKEANVRKVMNGKVLVQLRKNKRVDILGVKMDKKGEIWYEVQPQGSATVGYVRDYLIKLDDGVELILPTATPKPETTPEPEKATEEPAAKPEAEAEEKEEESILDREIIGKGKTKRAANVRVKPAASGKLVRQLSKGNALLILEKYQDAEGNIWYEVSTESGKTHGFVRDYLLENVEIDEAREAKTYGESTEKAE